MVILKNIIKLKKRNILPLVLKRTNDLLNDLLCFSLHLIDSENKEIEFISKEKKLASLTSSLKFSNEQKHKKTKTKTKRRISR